MSRKTATVPSKKAAESLYAPASNIPQSALIDSEIREGVRLPLFHRDNPNEEYKEPETTRQNGKSDDSIYCYLVLNDVKLSISQKGKVERGITLNDPRKEIEEAIKKQTAAKQSSQARHETSDRINQRKADASEAIRQGKRAMGIP
jgi:hypothetical protein